MRTKNVLITKKKNGWVDEVPETILKGGNPNCRVGRAVPTHRAFETTVGHKDATHPTALRFETVTPAKSEVQSIPFQSWAMKTLYGVMTVSLLLLAPALYAQEIEQEIITDETITVPFEEVQPVIQTGNVDVVITKDGNQDGVLRIETVPGHFIEHNVVVQNIDPNVQNEIVTKMMVITDQAQEAVSTISDNKQEIDKEWFGQTQKNIGIMSKVFDHVLSNQIGEGYQKSGFFNKGCQGFWLPETGVMFQLQVNFPLEDKTEESVELQDLEPGENDLWNKLEKQLSGKDNDVKLTLMTLKKDTANADRTEELKNLIIDTIAKYGLKFEGMGENDSIIVMVQSPQENTVVVNSKRFANPMPLIEEDQIIDNRLRTDVENAETVIEDYQLQLEKLINKVAGYRQQLTEIMKKLEGISQKKQAGIIPNDSNEEFEYKQKEIEMKSLIRDTEIDIEPIQKKLHELGLEELELQLDIVEEKNGKPVEHEKKVSVPVSEDKDFFRTEAHVVLDPTGQVTTFPVQGRTFVGNPLQLQTIPNNKTMVIQIPFKDLKPPTGMFESDNEALKKEHAETVKDKFRVTVY